MLNKGIAIRTILLMVVGTLVAGLIIFLVYSVTTGSTLSATACQSRVISWCTNCKLLGSEPWENACGNPPNRCPCLGVDPRWSDWVSKCVKGSAASDPWNFDPSASPNNYEQSPDGYCPRVGIS